MQRVILCDSRFIVYLVGNKSTGLVIISAVDMTLTHKL